MIEIGIAVTVGLAIAGGVMGYGELRGKVTAQAKAFEDSLVLLRADIKRLDDRVADLTDFLLREAHGEIADQIRGAAPVVNPCSRS